MLFGSGKGSVACIYVALSEAWIALYQSHINARCHLESRALWLVLWRSSVAGNSVHMSLRRSLSAAPGRGVTERSIPKMAT